MLGPIRFIDVPHQPCRRTPATHASETSLGRSWRERGWTNAVEVPRFRRAAPMGKKGSGGFNRFPAQGLGGMKSRAKWGQTRRRNAPRAKFKRTKNDSGPVPRTGFNAVPSAFRM
jgi:hypothetical protein